MDKKDASRIQSAYARKNGGVTPKSSFAARAQRTADKRHCDSKGPDQIRKAGGSNDPDHSPNGIGGELLVAGVMGSIDVYLLYKVSQQQARRQEAEARVGKLFEIVFVIFILAMFAMIACLLEQKLHA